PRTPACKRRLPQQSTETQVVPAACGRRWVGQNGVVDSPTPHSQNEKRSTTAPARGTRQTAVLHREQTPSSRPWDETAALQCSSVTRAVYTPRRSSRWIETPSARLRAPRPVLR